MSDDNPDVREPFVDNAQSVTLTFASSSIMVPTMNLRFSRDGRLQQEWRDVRSPKVEWRDVPREGEE